MCNEDDDDNANDNNDNDNDDVHFGDDVTTMTFTLFGT